MPKVAPGAATSEAVTPANRKSYTEFHKPQEVEEIEHAHMNEDEVIDHRRPTLVVGADVHGLHGKRYYFAPTACGCLDLENPLRKAVIKVITNHWFDRTILTLILINSVIMALTDFGNINDDYEPIPDGSWRNALGTNTEIFFVVAFTIEMVLKIIGMGFWKESYSKEFNSVGKPSTYLRDWWNILDFVVVITGYAAFIPGLPNVSVIRTFRVLRPLKSVAGLEGVKMVIVAVTNSIPELMSVIVLLIFVFAIFGILGLQFFLGMSHSRCRLTPYPVTTDWVVGMDYTQYACLSSADDVFSDDRIRRGSFNKVIHQDWSKDGSAWAEKKDCYWPLDPDDDRLCTHKGPGMGMHECWHGEYFEEYVQKYNPDASETWCGSNWDAMGNGRFKSTGDKLLDIFGQDHEANGRTFSAVKLKWSANYFDSYQYGFIDFDNFARAFLTIFQTITLEGWTDVMYVLMDAYDPTITGAFFVILVCFGSFFVLNLLLAVLENNYNEEESKFADRKAREAAAEEQQVLDEQLKALNGMSDNDVGAAIDKAAGWNSDFPMGDFDFGALLEGIDPHNKPNTWCNRQFGWCLLDPESEEAKVRPPWRQRLYDFVEHPKFGLVITLCIVANTVCLACDHHPMEPEFENNLEIFNFIFTLIFVIEMFLKLPGLGLRAYLSDHFNVFDGIIVLVSIVESITIPPSFIKKSDSSAGGGISALRSFRLFRIFKLARDWPAMRQLLDLIVKTALQMGNFMLLFTIFIYIYALLGMQFFAGRMHFDEDGYPVDINEGGSRAAWKAAEVPRSNFDTLVWASTTIFSILSGENWNTVMYDGMRAAGWGGVFYFVTLIVFGMFIVMNIFMAILLANFDELGASDENDEEEDGAGKDGKVAPDPGLDDPETGAPVIGAGKANLPKVIHPGVDIGRNGPATQIATQIKKALPGYEEQPAAPQEHFMDTHGKGSTPGAESAHIFEDTEPETVLNGKSVELVKLGGGDPLPILGEGDSCLRATCRKIVTRKWFDNGILVCIILSSVTLAIDNPLNDPNTALSQGLYILDWIMTVIFTVEMVLKIIGLGLWGHGEAYLTNGWNLLDGIIVIVGWIGLTADSSLSAFKALRALRALKPLRMINRYPGLQIVVGTMISSVGAIANVAIVTLLVFLIFAIMAVNYLKGKFYSCQGDGFDAIGGTAMEDFLVAPKTWAAMTADEKSWFQVGAESSVSSALFYDNAASTGDDDWALGCSGSGDGLGHCCADIDWSSSEPPTSRDICACWNMDWGRVIYQRFDNTWVALGALYEISTTEGWVDVMLAAVDAPTVIGMQPIENNNEAWIIFFIFFMVIGSFLMTNLFVGVIIQNFNDLKEEKEKEAAATGRDDGDIFMTDDQRMWAMTQKLLAQMIEMQFYRPSAPSGAVRQWCFNLVQNPNFDAGIIGCIIANTFVMAVSYFGMSDDFSAALEALNFVFAMIFNVECVLKLVALDKTYFYHMMGKRVVLNNWNLFDFVVVLGTNIGMVVSPPFSSSSGGGGGVATVIRMFRIGRLLRLINGAASIKKMFDTLIMTLPGLGNVAAVVFLLFFIFAVIGVQLFATVAYHESLGPHANFRTFGTAFMTLLRFATGENWNGYMYEAAHAGYSGWHDTEAGLESDATNPKADKDSGSGWCDPDVSFDDKFVGGDWDGEKYGDVMCGFVTYTSIFATQADGCVELNGCANFFIFPYLKSFTLLITFVFLNLFVGIILDGFSQAEEQSGAATISEHEFLKIWTHWVTVYDTEETYCIDIFKVKSFLQTLHQPWGFGLDYVASDAELIYRVKDLNLTVGPDGKIHFFKVLKGLSRRHLALTRKEALVDIDAMEHTTAASPDRRSAMQRQLSHLPGMLDVDDGKPGTAASFDNEEEMEDLSMILARMVIRKALRAYLVRYRYKRTVGLAKAQGAMPVPAP